MNYDNLPTDDLKEFGIIGADNTFLLQTLYTPCAGLFFLLGL